MKKYPKILVFLAFVIALPAYAQTGGRNQNREKLRSQRIAFITNRLELTPEEAKAFWPVYDEYESKRQEIVKLYHQQKMSGHDNPDQLTDKEALEIADSQLIEAQKLLDLRKEYHNKFKQVLPAKKILKLYDSEREFQKMLLDRLRDKHHHESAPQGGRPPVRNQEN